MLLDKEFLNKFDNEFTDRQRQIALVGVISQLHLQTYDEYLEFLKDPRSFLFTKGGKWAGSRIVDAVSKAYNDKKIKENPYTEKFLEDIIYVNSVITEDLQLPNFHSDDNNTIEELFLLDYEKHYAGEMLPDVDLNRRFLTRFSSDQHYSWYFPRTKCFRENTIKRMYVTVELYLEKNEILKDYYNSLKKYNSELKDDSIKLVNEINKDTGNSRKVTLYNCINPVSKEIWKYPLCDLAKHKYKVSWSKAFNDPKLEEYFIKEFESEEIDKSIDYSEFYNIFTSHWQMGEHSDIGRRLVELDGFKEKYLDAYARNHLGIFEADDLISDFCNNQVIFGALKIYLEKLVEYFPYMQESLSSLREIFDYCNDNLKSGTSIWDIKRRTFLYEDPQNLVFYDLTKEDDFKKFIKHFNDVVRKNR